MKKLKILSIGRNNRKRIEKVDQNAGTLEQIWASYNSISNLDGVVNLSKLTTLYLSNNQIKDIAEVAKLQVLPELRDVLFKGNPFCKDQFNDDIDSYRAAIIKCLPQLAKLDGQLITQTEKDAALSS